MTKHRLCVAARWAAFFMAASMATGCTGVGDMTDHMADQWAPAETMAQRAYRVAVLAAPLVSMVHDQARRPAISPTVARDMATAACEAAHALTTAHALAATGDRVAVVFGTASQVLLSLADQTRPPAGSGPSPTSPNVLARVAAGLADVPILSARVAAGRATLFEMAAAGRDPDTADWDMILTPVRAVVEDCTGDDGSPTAPSPWEIPGAPRS